MSADQAMFDINLRAIRRLDPAFAKAIEAIEPAPLTWSEARDGSPVATLDREGQSVALASRYAPLKEAEKLVADIDHAKHACVVILGFGLGYHVAQAAADMKSSGVLVVFEPDLGVMRASLEHIDHSGWLSKSRVVFAHSETDRAGLVSRLEPHSGVITQGAKIVAHPPTRQGHTQAISTFADRVMEVLAYCRTNIATALVNASRTCSNLTANLPHYVAGATINELHNAARGYPAVCVAAGPSLVKNVDLLQNPVVRKNVVVIAVQTALRPLLDRGIEPDFVTALDYSAISARFYEGLPPLPNVTLVAEAKAHPTVIENFPGPVRVLRSAYNDDLLGSPEPGTVGLADSLHRPILSLKSGATVAHLSFYLAQHLGCDPILFIGQDLGFSDGLYYAPGTAVHRVWSSEVNPFNTIEMMEWQRIVRMRGNLRRAEDVHGRPIFTDEQMATYLKQFERDFADAEQRIIDCTEGGMPKAHTQRATLAEALAEHAARPVPALPVPDVELDADRLARLSSLLKQRTRETGELRRVTAETIPILRKMQKHQRDPRKMEGLFKKMRQKQDRIHSDLAVIFKVVNALNTMGVFRRQRTDRAIGHLATDQYDKQYRQLDRDADNLEWLIQACDETLKMLAVADERTQKIIQTHGLAVAA